MQDLDSKGGHRGTQHAAPQSLAPQRRDNAPLGMLWYGASSFFFAAMGACSFPVWQITLARAVVMMTVCLVALWREGVLRHTI
jgi:heme exporter protein D